MINLINHFYLRNDPDRRWCSRRQVIVRLLPVVWEGEPREHFDATEPTTIHVGGHTKPAPGDLFWLFGCICLLRSASFNCLATSSACIFIIWWNQSTFVYSLINMPTRITELTSMLIDNIFTNNFQEVHKSGIFVLISVPISLYSLLLHSKCLPQIILGILLHKK